MAQIRLTKNELRSQQHKLNQLERYLPTLQLKKAMLQSEVNQVGAQIERLEIEYKEQMDHVDQFAPLMSGGSTKALFEASHISDKREGVENIAGVEIPTLEEIEFVSAHYSLFTTPYWWDSAIVMLRKLIEQKEQVAYTREKKRLLEEELRAVSIRVNLFEKILIPRTKENIKKIKVFLSDQQLSAVATSKVAKQKIEAKRQA